MVGIYLLSQLQELDLIIGLYRDDGLAVSRLKERQTELRKKKICKIFKDNGLKITTEANAKCVNFLDVTFNLETGLYKPYMKPNHTPTYVHVESNHPPSIIKNIPKSVNKRLSTNSSNEEIFKEACKPYQQALQNSGYAYKLEFIQRKEKEKTKPNRSRNITYFNPPFSKNVQTNLGQHFLKLIKKCFPENHPLAKVVNRNNVKLSYKTMPNLQKLISNHNRKIQNPKQTQEQTPSCNCRETSDPCPMDGNCLVDKLVYRATVTDENEKVETYTGLTSKTFKTRYYGHSRSFREKESEHSTTLSTHIWKLKNKNKNFNVRWEVVARANDFNPISRKCQLCLKEKYYILFHQGGATLNKRSELFSTCRHRLRRLLSNT